MLLRVRFMSRHAAETRLKPSRRVVAVSITDPDTEPARLADGFAQILRISFWDVIRPVQGYEPISDEQADQIVKFLARWHAVDRGYNLAVHCEAGVSRSAAVAWFAAEAYGAKRLHGLREFAFANIEVLRKLRRAAGLKPPFRHWTAFPQADPNHEG